MAQTYTQLQKQIEQLQRQAKVLRDEEAKGVIERIKEAIAVYSLTAEQLGFGSANSHAALAAPTPKPTAKQAPKPAAKGKGKPGFSDKSGNVWTGRGPHPAWLREALQAGHDKNEFRIGNRAAPKKTPAPLALTDGTVATSTPPASLPASPSRKAPRVSYADDAGHAWSGMGPTPRWLKARIEAGKTLADFAR